MDRRQRDALRAQQDDFLDRQNEFGRGQPDKVGGVAKRRPARPNGNAREAILRRLRRDYPQLHQLVLNGEISPHRAAIQAGFRKPPGRQPKVQRPINRSDITATQEMELWLGAIRQRLELCQRGRAPAPVVRTPRSIDEVVGF